MRDRSKGVSKTAVIGVGNILMGDEGIGVRAIQALEHESLPKDVTLIDGGTAFPALAGDLTDYSKLIIVDAVNGGASPGTIYRFQLEEILKGQSQTQSEPSTPSRNTGAGILSLHDLGVIGIRDDVLEILRLLVHLVPPESEHLVEEEFDQPVMAKCLQRPEAAGPGEGGPPVFLVGHQGRIVGREPPEHPRHRGRREIETAGDPARRRNGSVRLDLVNRFQIIIYRPGSGRAPHCFRHD